MNRRNIPLDFTSLLDVILILLFIVAASVGHSSASVKEEAANTAAKAEARANELEHERSALEKALEESKISGTAANAELAALQEQYAELMDEHEFLKLSTGYDANDISVYRSVLERVTKVALICGTAYNAETGNHEVDIDIYVNAESGQTHAGRVTLEHDFDLSRGEREKLAAAQAVELAKALSEATREAAGSVLWFTVQYAYNDVNFSNTDLEIIGGAVESLERSFARPCYVEEIRLY